MEGVIGVIVFLGIIFGLAYFREHIRRRAAQDRAERERRSGGGS
jgi:hypothetical protein